MTNKKSTGEEIGKLIDKLWKDWARADVNENRISRIDKDIIISHLRELYDLVYDLETTAQAGHESSKEIPDYAAKEEKEENPPSPPGMASSGLPTKQQDDNSNSLQEDSRPEAPADKAPDQQVKPDKPEEQSSYHPGGRDLLNNKIDSKSKATVDLFTPSKTLSDVYKSDHDNSLAAKINQHRIEDIRSAIGLNDKFLMINHIFGGEMSRYNQAIDKLNQFEHFHEALQFVDELRTGANHGEKQAACNKLLDIVKRKFH